MPHTVRMALTVWMYRPSTLTIRDAEALCEWFGFNICGSESKAAVQ